ncbi:MAG: EamA family transporter RarD [Pseudomonadota bacterium]
MAEPVETEAREGVLAAIAAYTIWGFLPVYLIFTIAVPATELLMHRIVWSVPFGALIISVRSQWADVRDALMRPRRLGWLALAAFFIAVNWLVYILAVQNQQIFQASLGYYINPLVYVLVGVVFFGETLRVLQLFAVLLATAGVLVLTFSGGEFPWVSLILAVSFTIYGVIRKQISVGAMPGLFVETLLLMPIALAGLAWLTLQGSAVYLEADAGLLALIVIAGPLTVVPLLFFAIGARLLRLSTIGFLQFIGPTLQFAVGWYYGETLTPARAVCFALIWSAVIVFCVDSLRARRKSAPGGNLARAKRG